MKTNCIVKINELYVHPKYIKLIEPIRRESKNTWEYYVYVEDMDGLNTIIRI